MRHRHTSPFEMCEIKLHVRVPMDCWRQWIRHRTASINEYSTRYSIAIDATQDTKPEEWRLQATSNRQGSEGFLDPQKGEKLSAQESELHEFTRKVYNERIELGIAREQALKDLPLSTYTEAYWKIDLHNLLNLLLLRMALNAQYEIRCYANTIGNEIVKKWCPITWEAFEEYYLYSTNISRTEIAIIRALHQYGVEGAIETAREIGILPKEGEIIHPDKEREEIEENLDRLGITIPWKSSR